MKYNVKRHAVVQPQDDSIRLIPLTQGQNSIVDAADYDVLMEWNWCASWNKCTKSFYAVRANGKQRIWMHRFILGLFGKAIADHINHDTLDNRRCNLREATKFQNKHNRRIPKNNSSGAKGVDWSERDKRWRVRIMANGILTTVGYFRREDFDLAKQAYNEAAKKYHGDFALFNH